MAIKIHVLFEFPVTKRKFGVLSHSLNDQDVNLTSQFVSEFFHIITEKSHGFVNILTTKNFVHIFSFLEIVSSRTNLKWSHFVLF